jgi:hypothetical protein
VAAILATLLPNNMVPNKRSGESNKRWISCALRCPESARLFIRYRLTDIIAVSEEEKNADSKINRTRATPKNPIGISFTVYLHSRYDLGSYDIYTQYLTEA